MSVWKSEEQIPFMEVTETLMAVPSTGKSEKLEKSPAMEWSEMATRTMLSLYKDYKVKVEDKTILTRAKMWVLLNEKMKEKGYNFTPSQVENRWKTLERTYRRHMRDSLRNGGIRKTGLYEKEMIELHANDAVYIPEEIITDSRLDKGMNELFFHHHFPIEGVDGNGSPECVLSEAVVCEPFVTSPTATSSSTTSSNVLAANECKTETTAILIQIRQDMQQRHLERQLAAQKRHEEKMELIKTKNRLMEKKIELLQNLVDSLKKN